MELSTIVQPHDDPLELLLASLLKREAPKLDLAGRENAPPNPILRLQFFSNR